MLNRAREHNRHKCGFAVALLMLCLAGSAAAESFDAYHARVDRAVEALDELLAAEDAGALRGDSSLVVAAFREMRNALPPRVAIEREKKGPVQADNSWLESALREYEQDSAERTAEANRAALAGIAQRLQALDERLLDLEQSEQNNAGEDPDRARLEAILARMKQARKQTDEQQTTALARLAQTLKDSLRQFFNWLRNLLPSLPRIQPASGPSRLPTVALILIGAVLVGLLALLGWKFGPRLLSIFRRKKVKEERAARVVLGERVEADESASDLFAEAEALAQRGEMRAAIRKAYVALLCELGDRKLLRLAQHKTNRDYLQALRARPALYAQVQPLTNNFETYWYGAGETNVKQHDWDIFRDGCRQALRSDK